MIPVRRVAAFTLISGGLALGTLAVADVAHADPGTRDVAWLVTSGSFANRFGTPQTLYTGSLECGTGLLQIDTYTYVTDADKATVDNLIASGHLDSSAQDGSVWLSNKDVELTPCATTPSSTALPVPTTSGPANPSPSPTASVPVVTDSPAPSASPLPTSATTSPAAVPSASPALTATSTPTSTPVAAGSNRNGTGTTEAQTNGSTELAYTGTNTGPAIGGAVALLTAGLVMLALRRKGKKA